VDPGSKPVSAATSRLAGASDLVQPRSAASLARASPDHSGLLNISLDSVEQVARDPSGISGSLACSLSCCHQHGSFITSFLSLYNLLATAQYTRLHVSSRIATCPALCSPFGSLTTRETPHTCQTSPQNFRVDRQSTVERS